VRQIQYILPAGVLLLLSGLSSSAEAKGSKKEDQWAQCLWETVPQSSANWLDMPNKDKAKFGPVQSPRTLLEYRLQAACFERLKLVGKSYPIGFSSEKVRRSLELSRPNSVGVDTFDPKAFQCERFFTNDTDMKNPAAYKWGFGDFDSGPVFASISYIFAAEKGGGLGLPETGGLHKCHWINSDGTLTDA
jgi:hypothetical protein